MDVSALIWAMAIIGAVIIFFKLFVRIKFYRSDTSSNNMDDLNKANIQTMKEVNKIIKFLEIKYKDSQVRDYLFDEILQRLTEIEKELGIPEKETKSKTK